MNYEIYYQLFLDFQYRKLLCFVCLEKKFARNVFNVFRVSRVVSENVFKFFGSSGLVSENVSNLSVLHAFSARFPKRFYSLFETTIVLAAKYWIFCPQIVQTSNVHYTR